MLVRPQGFGKTFLASLAADYFDEAAADRFADGIAGSSVARQISPSAGKYHVLRLSFLGFPPTDPVKTLDEVLKRQLAAFFCNYPHPFKNTILHSDFVSPALRLERFFTEFVDRPHKFFVIVDEYGSDRDSPAAQAAIKDLFLMIKSAAGSGAVSRLFVIGSASPDFFLSDFAIAKDLSERSVFAAAVGFTDDELRDRLACRYDANVVNNAMALLKSSVKAHCFSPNTDEMVRSASECLSILRRASISV